MTRKPTRIIKSFSYFENVIPQHIRVDLLKIKGNVTLFSSMIFRPTVATVSKLHNVKNPTIYGTTRLAFSYFNEIIRVKARGAIV